MQEHKDKIKQALARGNKEEIEEALSNYWFEKKKEISDDDLVKVAEEIFGPDKPKSPDNGKLL